MKSKADPLADRGFKHGMYACEAKDGCSCASKRKLCDLELDRADRRGGRMNRGGHREKAYADAKML